MFFYDLTIGRKRVMMKSSNRPSVEKGGLFMTYAELFSEIKGKFMGADVSNIKEHLAYQFNITGEGEGIFYAEVKDGKLSVEPYDYHNRHVTFTCSGKTLLQIADGKLDPIMAVTLQKLKFEGDVDKALKLKEMLDSRK